MSESVSSNHEGSTVRILTVYVPVKGTILHDMILPGSAMAGTPTPDERVILDYEGNRYGAMNMKTYEDKLRHAAGRHVESYPTVARRLVKAADLVEVGTYDVDAHALTVTDQAALDNWCSP